MLDHIEAWVQKVNSAALFLWAPLALFAPRAIHLPLFILAVTGCFTHRFKNIRLLDKPAWGFLGLFLLWALVSTQWSLDQRFAFRELAKLIPILAAAGSVILYFHHLSRGQIDRYLKAVIFGFSLATVIVGIDRLLDYPMMGIVNKSPALTYSRFITLMCLQIWGILLILPPSRWKLFMALALLSGTAAFFWTYDFDAGPVGIICAIVAMLMTFSLPKLTSLLLRVGAVITPILVVIGFGLFMTQDHWQKVVTAQINCTHQQRLEMIDWASKKIIERPLGYGFAQTRALSAQDKITGYSLVDGQVATNTIWEKGTWHLHNGLLQIFLELGIVGFLLISGVICILVRDLWGLGLDRYRLGVMHGYVTTLLFILSVGFGIWQTWWLSTIMMLTILLAFKASYERQIDPNSI